MNTASVPGTWIVTASGRALDFAAPDPAAIVPDDVAHALSNLCRFGGHVRAFYSVAQHCVLVSNLVPEAHALAGLLHDAAEAYVGDLVGPLKWQVPEFQRFEARVAAAVAERFGLHPSALHAPEVREADLRALCAEARALLPVPPRRWPARECWDPIAAAVTIEPWAPERARRAFLARLAELWS